MIDAMATGDGARILNIDWRGVRGKSRDLVQAEMDAMNLAIQREARNQRERATIDLGAFIAVSEPFENKIAAIVLAAALDENPGARTVGANILGREFYLTRGRKNDNA